MTTPDPLLADLHVVIGKIADRVLERPDWLREMSPGDLVLIRRALEVVVLIESGRTDVIH